jgi:hypothetical protein
VLLEREGTLLREKKEEEEDGTPAGDSLQYINHGRGMPNYFTRNEKKCIEIFSKKQDKNGM